MANDTTIKSLFDHAKGPVTGEFPRRPTVFATYIEHSPQEQRERKADTVLYANGPLKLSSDQRTLSGAVTIWRNRHTQNVGPGTTGPNVIAFDADKGQETMAITITDSGQATLSHKLGGKNFLGRPPRTLNATFDNAMFVERGAGASRSLSFTLGSHPA